MKILTVTLNPAFDVHCHADVFEARRENLAHITDCDAGGKGVNVSRALASCGIGSTALVVVGEENGDAYLRAIKTDGVKCISLTVPGRIRENITIHTDGTTETRLSFDGFEAPDGLIGRVAQIVSRELSSGDVMTLCGRLPRGMDIAPVKDFLRSVASRGIMTVIDSGSFTLADLCEVRPYLIKPNEQETAAFTGHVPDDVGDALSCARGIHERGIENVMISLGARGAVLCNSDGEFSADAPHVRAVSTIGAGDSAIAGFLAALASGKIGRELLRGAVAYGSAACMTTGTKSPRRDDILKLLNEIK
ncbi:MAG: 1-phosphofructokinase family hexose kinase [Clostridia bacterium]|nr:1-phosphofructokinase family hexose kinase [Clostridia bacterium]